MGKRKRSSKNLDARLGKALQGLSRSQNSLQKLVSDATKVAEVLAPKRDTIALCGQGKLGVIEDDEPHEITYADDTKGVAYVGSHLDGSGSWSSRNPRVVAHFPGLTDILKQRDQAVRDAERERLVPKVLGTVVSYDRSSANATLHLDDGGELTFSVTCFYGLRGQDHPIPDERVRVVFSGKEILAVLAE